MSKIIKLSDTMEFQKKAKEEYKKGLEIVNKKDYEGSLIHFKAASRLDPNKAEYPFMSGLSSFHIDDRGTMNYFKAAYELNPMEEKYAMWFGISLYHNGEYLMAKKVFLKAYSFNAKDDRLTLYLSMTLNRLGDYLQVISILENGIGIENLNTSELTEYAISLYKAKKNKEAEVAFRGVLDIDSKKILPYHYLVSLLNNNDEYFESKMVLKRFKEKFPEKKEMAENMGESIEIFENLSKEREA